MPDTPATSGVTPYLSIDGASEAIEFYKRAFGAIERARTNDDSGKRIMHGHIEINGSPVFMSDFFPEYGHAKLAPQAFNLHIQVDDAQSWWDRAVEAGCTIQQPLKEQFWGDIYGQLSDPYGVTWAIGQSQKS